MKSFIAFLEALSDAEVRKELLAKGIDSTKLAKWERIQAPTKQILKQFYKSKEESHKAKDVVQVT